MSAAGWGCPHETDGLCSKVKDLRCDPGMKGCTLYGRYAFFDDSKNARSKQKQAQTTSPKRDGEPAHGSE